MGEERYTVARVFRSYLDTTAKLGLREEISRDSPELKKLFDKPPIDTARIPGPTCDRLYEAVYKARGRDAIRSFGYDALRGEGYLQYFFEASGTPGTVETAVLAADQLGATIAVHW